MSSGGSNPGSAGSTSRATSGAGLSTTSTWSKLEGVVFSILYTMVKDNNSPWPSLRLIFIVVDTLQILGFAFDSDTNWGFGGFQKVMMLANNPFEMLTSNAFFVIFGTIVTAVCLSFLNFYFVARDLMDGELSYVWPVRTLRFLCTLCVTIFFMPILNVLLVFLQCDNNGSVMNYPELRCWSSFTIAPAVVSIMLLIVFIPCSIVFRLIFFNPAPLSSDPLARPLSRIETLWLILKTILVMVFRFVYNPTIEAVVLILASLIVLLSHLVTMPMYRRSTNHIFASAFSINLGAGTGMMFATLDLPAAVRLSILGTLILLFAIFGVLASEMRWRQLHSRGLQVVATAHERLAEETNVTVDRSVVEIVAETKTGNIVSSFEARLLTRVLLQSSSLTDEIADQVESLFKYAVELYPRDAALLVSYASFLTHFRKNPQAATLQNRQIAKLNPAFDVRFLAYCAERVCFEENKARSAGEGRLDVLTFLEFQKMYNQTKRFHKETLKIMKTFWKALLADNVSLSELRRLTGKITAAEQKASAAYSQILKSFPHNKQIYRSAAAFMADVHHDYDMAAYYEEQAEELDADKGDDADSKRSALTWTRANLDEASILEHKAYRENLKNRKSQAVERLSKVTTCSLLVVCAFAIIIFVVVDLLLIQFDMVMSVMEEVGMRTFLFQSSLLHTSEMVLAITHNNSEEYAMVAHKFYVDMDVANILHQQLYDHSYGVLSAEIDAEWTDPQIEFYPMVANASTFMTDQKDGSVSYIVVAEDVASLSMDDFQHSYHLVDFLLKNSFAEYTTPYLEGKNPKDRLDSPALVHSFNRLALLVSLLAQYDVNLTLIVQVCLAGCACFLLTVLGVMFFRPALNAVQQERDDTFSLFLAIPKNIVQEVYDGVSDGEKNATKSSKKSKHTVVEEDDESADATDRRFRLQLWAALALIGLLFILTAIVLSVLLVSTNEIPTSMTNSERRRVLTERAAFLGMALLAKHENHAAMRALPSFVELSANLQDTLDKLLSVHRVVLSGGLDIDGQTAPNSLKSDHRHQQLNNEQQCVINPPPCEGEVEVEFRGLEKILQYFITKGRAVASLTEDEFEAHSMDLEDFLRVRNYLLDGLRLSSELIADHAHSLSFEGQIDSAIFLAVNIFIVLVLFAVLFRPVIRHLRLESYRTSSLLLMIPPAAISEVDAVRVFLETGKLTAVSGKRGLHQSIDEHIIGEYTLNCTDRSGGVLKRAVDTAEEESLASGGKVDPQTAVINTLMRMKIPFLVVDSYSTILDVSYQCANELEYAKDDLVGQNLSVLFDNIGRSAATLPLQGLNSTDLHSFQCPQPSNSNVEDSEFAHMHARYVLESIKEGQDMPAHSDVTLVTRSGVLKKTQIFMASVACSSGPVCAVVFNFRSPFLSPKQEDDLSSSYGDSDDKGTFRTTLDSSYYGARILKGGSKVSLISSLERKSAVENSPGLVRRENTVPMEVLSDIDQQSASLVDGNVLVGGNNAATQSVSTASVSPADPELTNRARPVPPLPNHASRPSDNDSKEKGKASRGKRVGNSSVPLRASLPPLTHPPTLKDDSAEERA